MYKLYHDRGGGLHVINTLKARGSVIIYSNKKNAYDSSSYNYHSLVQTACYQVAESLQ